MILHIGETAPDFNVDTQKGEISLHDWTGDSWVYFFSHPADALQFSDKHGVATPADCREGKDAIIPPSVSDEDAKARFPQGFTTLRPYLRMVKID